MNRHFLPQLEWIESNRMSTKSSSSPQTSKQTSTQEKRNPQVHPSQQRVRLDAQRAAQVKQLAIASVLLASLSFFISFFGCVPAIVCGHIVRAACKKQPDLPGGGLALAGLVIGYFMLVANIIGIIILLWIAVNTGNASAAPVVDPFR